MNPQQDSTRIARRRGPRHRIGCEAPAEHSEDLRFFRDLTGGLSNRLPYPNIEAQRAGTALNPITGIRRILISGRGIGLPKEWAIRLWVHIGHTIDSLWPMEATCRSVLQQREMQREAENDFAEKQLDLEKTQETVRACLDTCLAEIAAQKLVAAKLRRELEEMEAQQ